MTRSVQAKKELLPLLTPLQTGGSRWFPIIAAFLVAGLSACSPEKVANEEESSAEAEPSSLPAIYVDRKIESLIGGENDAQKDYHHMVSVCESAGVAVTPLSQDEVAKLGTKRWQFWRMPGRMAYKIEIWNMVAGDIREGKSCQFELGLDGTHAYFDESKSEWVDLATGERTQGEAQPNKLQVFDASPTDNDWVAWKTWEKPTDKTVAGQPCKEWRSPRGDVACYWSGGTQWGFSHMPSGIFASNAGFPTTEIVLQAEPAPDTIGDRLTTTQFILGASFDPQEMQP